MFRPNTFVYVVILHMISIHVTERTIRQVCIFILWTVLMKWYCSHAPRQDLWQYQTYGLPLCASVKFTDHILLKVLLIQDTFKLELDLGIICFILGIHSGDCFWKKMFVLKTSRLTAPVHHWTWSVGGVTGTEGCQWLGHPRGTTWEGCWKYSVARWPWPPLNNSKQAVSKNNLRWEIGGGESGRE